MPSNDRTTKKRLTQTMRRYSEAKYHTDREPQNAPQEDAKPNPYLDDPLYNYLKNNNHKKIYETLVGKAKMGHAPSIKFVLERILPQERKGAILPIAKRKLRTIEDVDHAFDEIYELMAEGLATNEEAESVIRILEQKRKIIEVRDLIDKADDLEEKLNS